MLLNDLLIRSIDHGAENGVFSIQPRRRNMGNKKLTAVSMGTGIGHGQHTGLSCFKSGSNSSRNS